MPGNAVRKANKRLLKQSRTHTAYIENYLEELQKQYAPAHPEIGQAMQQARELNSILDDLLDKIDQAI